MSANEQRRKNREQTVELTYPISDRYVSDWTPVRAAAEIYANALDEDPSPRIVRNGDRISINDKGPGWQPRNLILGESNKTDKEIGQFGEGAKIALLVLARDGRRPVVHTQGTIIEAGIERRTIGLGDRREHVDLLVLRMRGARRINGTTVSFVCTAAEEAALRQRFLRLSTRGYRPPEERSRVVAGEGGRIYVGGVLLAGDRDLLLSYDLPLTRAKHLIGRDRDIVDPWELGREIGEAIGATHDEDSLHRIAAAAIEGTLPHLEQRFVGRHVDTPQRRRAWSRVRNQLLGGQLVYWDEEDGSQERRLQAEDSGWRRIPARSSVDVHREIMTRLNIPHINKITTTPKRRRLPRVALTDTEKHHLSLVRRRIRRHLGDEALTRVVVFEEHTDEECRGEYDPNTDVIRIRRDQLATLTTTAEVLLHETAHRQARAQEREWWDRTRGFEATLTEMAAALLVGGRRTPKASDPAGQ